MQTKTEPQKKLIFEDLYNVLMETIEPELCTYNLSEVDELYIGEKEKNRIKRYTHYSKCLELFWDALKELIDMTRTDLKDFEDEFFMILKSRISGEEKQDLSDIEQSISES